MRAPSVVFFTLLLVAVGARAETAVTARVTGGAIVDTNPTRDFGAVGAADFGVTAVGDVAVEHTGDRLALGARYDLGGRQFVLDPSIQTLVQSLDANGSLSLGRAVAFGLDGSIKDRRGADHPYSDLFGGGRLSLALDEHGSIYVRVGAERFIYREQVPLDDGFRYSFATLDVSGGAEYRFDRRHGLKLTLSYQPRRYNALAQAPPNETPTGEQRRDSVLSASVGYTYRGPFQLGVSYGYVGQDSNSFGETVYRHHITALAGFRLPAKLLLFGQLNLQLARYPDGVYFSGGVALLQDDESTNSASLKLSRALSERLDVEVKAAVYQAELPQNALWYLRFVAGAGVSYRW